LRPGGPVEGEYKKLHAAREDIARVAGANIVPSDLRYLTDENIEEIGSDMTHVERMRLQAALQALQEETADAE